MNLKILFLLLMYYTILSLMFLMSGAVFNDYDNNITINDSGIGESEIDTGGVFGVGVSFTRFVGFVGLGIGLPDDVPDWFNNLFIAWQSLVLIFTIGFIISSVWDG